MTSKQFTPGKQYIWDSGFGYDIVEYVKPSGMYHHSAVKFLTGSFIGNIGSAINDRIRPMNDLDEMVREYGYDQSKYLRNY